MQQDKPAKPESRMERRLTWPLVLLNKIHFDAINNWFFKILLMICLVVVKYASFYWFLDFLLGKTQDNNSVNTRWTCAILTTHLMFNNSCSQLSSALFLFTGRLVNTGIDNSIDGVWSKNYFISRCLLLVCTLQLLWALSLLALKLNWNRTFYTVCQWCTSAPFYPLLYTPTSV